MFNYITLSRIYQHITILIMLLLMFIGLSFIISATTLIEQPYSWFAKKQCIGLIISLGIYALFLNIDIRLSLRIGYFAFYVLLSMLLLTCIAGSIGLGARRWLNIGFFRMQPAELAKLLYPAYVSFYLFDHEKPLRTYQDFLPLIIPLGISFILIFKQPDFGTALVVLLSGIITLVAAGFKKRWLCITLIGSLLLVPICWHYVLKPYQKQRLLVFFGYGHQLRERYQIEQAQIAIGSGGLWGKGYRQGTQNMFQFLPESRTDFIFAVIAEEWGFCGATAVILLFLLLFLHVCRINARIKVRWLYVAANGLVAHIMLCTFINIGMVIGLLPIVGIPLPFMSYGLSNLWVVMASLGWHTNIARYAQQYPL